MSRPWRWCLFAVMGVMAIAVLGGLVPRLVPSSEQPPALRAITSAAPVPLNGPLGCVDASCNKGATPPAAPTLVGLALFAVAAGVAAYAVTRSTRRNHVRATALARGTVLTLLRPPQSS